MRSGPRVFGTVIAIPALIGSLVIGAIPATASLADRTYLIGVDGAGPPGHDFEYVDYFPRGQVLPTDPPAVVGNGAILHFKYNLASLDGLHTATLLPPTETPDQAWVSHQLVVLDEPEPAPKPILNPGALFSSPAGCGTAANACVYTGADEVNSGALPAFGGTDFFVKVSLATSAPTTVHYICLIHPGMQGSV